MFGPFGCWQLAQQNLQIPEHANYRTIPLGCPSWIFDACLPREIGSPWPQAALMPFWSLPYVLKYSNCQTLLICTRCHAQDILGDVRKAHELNVSKRRIHLVEVKYREDTRPGHQLEAFRKQHRILGKRLKARDYFTRSILVWVALCILLILWIILKSLALVHQKTNKTALRWHAHSVLYAHKLTTTRRS